MAIATVGFKDVIPIRRNEKTGRAKPDKSAIENIKQKITLNRKKRTVQTVSVAIIKAKLRKGTKTILVPLKNFQMENGCGSSTGGV